jgi:secondary thiamine-phosphate synthase enzyme
MHIINIQTSRREQIIDITSTVQSYVTKEGFASGMLMVYSPHTTAAISVNENADPDIKKDLLDHLAKTVPHNGAYAHREGNADAHIKGSLINFSQTFIVENGKIQLGTWQGIFFMEFDGPRSREVWIKFIPGG